MTTTTEILAIFVSGTTRNGVDFEAVRYDIDTAMALYDSMDAVYKKVTVFTTEGRKVIAEHDETIPGDIEGLDY